MAPTKPADTGYEESAEYPRGRKARTVDPVLLEKLKHSADNGKAFARTAAPDVIDGVRRDLGSAAVRKKYDVTVETEKLESGHHRIKFSAAHKPTPVAASDGLE